MDKCYSLKDFSKKYDVDIIFDDWLRSKSRVENSISIIFENPSKSKILGVFGSKTDKIEMGCDNDLSNTAESFTHSTMQLIDDITSGYCGGTGRLERAVEEKAKEIEKKHNKHKRVRFKKPFSWVGKIKSSHLFNYLPFQNPQK